MRARSSKWLFGSLLLCFVAFGCSSGDSSSSGSGSGSGSGDSISSDTTDTADRSVPTTAPPTTTTETPPTTDPALGAEAAALATWTQVLDAAKTGAPNNDQIAVIESLANRNTAEQLKNFFPEAAARELDHYPQLTTQDDGTIAIDDCIIMNRGISTGISNWFTGKAEPNPNSPTGWTINRLQLINLDPCVPRSIADAAIQGYENYWDARGEFYDPPDPTSALIRQTTTDGHLDLVLDLIERFGRDGQRLSGRPTTDPHILEISSSTELIIIDCQGADPEFGVYDIETGERTDLIPPIKPNQTDLNRSTLIFEDERWKLSDLQIQSDFACAGTANADSIQKAGG